MADLDKQRPTADDTMDDDAAGPIAESGSDSDDEPAIAQPPAARVEAAAPLEISFASSRSTPAPASASASAPAPALAESSLASTLAPASGAAVAAAAAAGGASGTNSDSEEGVSGQRLIYLYAEHGYQGKRKTMEDTVDMFYRHPKTIESGGTSHAHGFFAVYDGHGGDKCAIYLQETLRAGVLAELEGRAEPFVPKDMVDSLSVGMAKSESQFIEIATEKMIDAGSTAVVALLSGKRLIIANVGDSEAVLCRAGAAVPLTTIHNPAKNESEEARVQAAGGRIYRKRVAHPTMPANLCNIAVSRAFGDVMFKAPSYTNSKPSGLIADPDFNEIKLTRDDAYLILACDGVWDVVSHEDAVAFVSRTLSEKNNDIKATVEALVMEAYNRGSTDNITALIVVFKWVPTGELANYAAAVSSVDPPPGDEDVLDATPHGSLTMKRVPSSSSDGLGISFGKGRATNLTTRLDSPVEEPAAPQQPAAAGLRRRATNVRSSKPARGPATAQISFDDDVVYDDDDDDADDADDADADADADADDDDDDDDDNGGGGRVGGGGGGGDDDDDDDNDDDDDDDDGDDNDDIGTGGAGGDGDGHAADGKRKGKGKKRKGAAASETAQAPAGILVFPGKLARHSGPPVNGSQRNVPGTKNSELFGWEPEPLDRQLGHLEVQQFLQQVIRLNPADMEAIVACPERVSEIVWQYEHLRQLTLELGHLAVMLDECGCTKRSCPQMKAIKEWLYLCAAHKAPQECSAMDYICHALDGAAALFNSNKHFPSRLQIDEAADKHLKSVARRLYRINAHAYFQHNDVFVRFEAETHLTERFHRLAELYALVPEKMCIVPRDFIGGPPPSAGE